MRRIACCMLFAVMVLSASSTPAAATEGAWTMAGPSNAVVTAIAASQSSPGHVYAGDQTGGMWRSTDDGGSWVGVPLPGSSSSSSPVEKVAVSPDDANVVIATRGCNLYASSDGGASWQSGSGLPVPPFCYGAYPVTFSEDGTAWALVGGGLYSSIDGGEDWTLVGSPPNSAGASALAIAEGDPQVIWVGTRTGTVATSSDGGATWQDRSQGLPGGPGSISQLIVDPADPADAYLLFGTQVYETTGGGPWAPTFSNAAPDGVYAIAIAPGSPETLIAVGDQAIHRSTDGGATWSDADPGPGLWYSASAVLAVDPVNASSVWFGGSGIYHSTDGAASFAWLPNATSAGSLNALVADPTDSQRVFAGTDSNGVVRSDDGGATWQLTGAGVVGQVRGLAADPYHSGVLFAAGNDLYRSDDNGDTWQPSDSGMSGVTNAIAADPDSAGTLYANGGPVLYRSTDDGMSWSACGSTDSTSALSSVAVDPTNDSTIYAGSPQGIFRSTDNCAHWTTISTNYADALSVGPDGRAYVATADAGAVAFAPGSSTAIDCSTSKGYDLPLATYAIAADPSRPGVAFAGTEQGTYETVDGGGRWAKLTTNGLTSTWSLSLLVSGDTVRTATSRGVATIQLTAPAATTGGSQVNGADVDLAGSGSGNGQSAQAFFEYGPTASYGQTTPSTDIGSGTDPTPVATQISATWNTTYHYRIVVVSGDGIAVGADQTATVPPLSPQVSLGTPKGITVTGATVRATIDPSGVDTTYHVEWGPTSSYGTSSPDVELDGSAGSTAVSVGLQNLSPATTYHYRVVASNGGGTTTSPDATFQTSALTLPQVSIGPPVAIDTSTASLYATVTPGNSDASYHFEWGPTTDYGSTAHAGQLTANTVTSVEIATLQGLTPDTTYHYRVVATNSAGTVTSADATFQTAALTLPQVALGTPTAVGTSTATLNASVDPGNSDASYHFEWGTTTSYGSTSNAGQLSANSGGSVQSATLQGLTPDTIYHYRVVVTNSAGTITSSDETVQTAAEPPSMLAFNPMHLAAGRIQSGRVPLQLSWSAQAGDAPICSYDLSRVDPAPAQALGSWGSPHATDLEAPGTLEYTARATGCDGQASDWLATPALRLSMLQETAAALSYHGAWKKTHSASATGGHLIRTTTAGSRLTYRFTGRDVALIAPTCPTCSAIRVSVDGAPPSKISLHSSSLVPQAIHLLGRFAASGLHTVTITAAPRDGQTRVNVEVDGVVQLA
jgi:photosystem II stability/assembly factor-like uncharacterized protein